MQFCFHLEPGSEEFAGRAYHALSVGAEVTDPLGPCFYSPCMFSLIDRFGVSWCLFT
jgi:PhnB protein